jgi:hypothetical protein
VAIVGQHKMCSRHDEAQMFPFLASQHMRARG